MSKRKIIAIILFNFIGLFLFTYIGPENGKIKKTEAVIKEENDIIDKVDYESDEDGDGFTNKEELKNLQEISNPESTESHPKTYPPAITLLGDNPYVMLVGSEYKEEGFEITLDQHDKVTQKDAVKRTGKIDTTKLGEYELKYTITDRYVKSASVTRTIKVVSPKADDDNDGYTNEEELVVDSNPLNKDDIPGYSKELSFDSSNCMGNMVVYDNIPDFNSCIVVTDEFYGTEKVEFTVDTSNIDNNNIGTYKIKVVAYDMLKNKSEKEFDFEVLKRNVTIVIDDKTSTYLSDIKEFTSNEKDVTIAGTDIGVVLSSDVTNESNVGSYDITGTWENTNYDVTFVNGKYQITTKLLEQLTENEIKKLLNIEFNNITTKYNGTEQSLLITGNLPSEIEVKYENNKGTDVGIYNAVATLTGTKNYSGSTTLDATLTINKASLTLKAEDKEITYGDAEEELTYVITSGEIFGNNNLMINLTREDVTNNNVGTYEIAITTAQNDNYNIKLINGTYVIKKAIPTYTIPTGLTGEEDMTLAEIELPEGFVYQDDTTVPLSPGTYTYKVTYTPKDTINYEIVTDIEIEVVIVNATYYTITFVDKDNNVLSTQSVRKNRSATEPTITEEYEENGKDYIFSGWIGNYIDVTADAIITPLYIDENTSTTYAYVLKPEYYMPEDGAGYDTSYYTNALETETGDKIPLSIKIGGLTEAQANSILNQQTTVVALGEENVMKYLTKSTKDQLEAITKGTDATGSYTIEWYVLKYQPDGWHLDGYKVYDTLTLDVSYNFSTTEINYSHLAFNFNNAVNDVTVTIDGTPQTVINSSDSDDIGNEYVVAYTKSSTEKIIKVNYTFKGIEYTKEYTLTGETITETTQNTLRMFLPVNYSLNKK